MHLRLANVFQFFTIYANVREFNPRGTTLPLNRSAIDRWIRFELDELIRTVSDHLDAYRVYEAARAIGDYVDALSNWYLRRSRARFTGDEIDAVTALWSLYDIFCVLARVIAPFAPFLAEAIWQRLGQKPDSVHLANWPKVPDRVPEADRRLSRDMALVRELASLGLSARAKVGVRVRQPLSALEVVLADPDRAESLEPLVPLLAEELNVREVRFTQEAERFVTFRVKPNFPRLGKQLGKEMKLLAKALAQADAATVRRGVLGGGYPIELPSGTFTLTEEDVVIEVQPREGFEAAGSARAVVALHADLDDDLREEGLAREITNRIQGRRKELDLGYTDRIRVRVAGDEAVRAAAERFEASIAGDVLARDFEVVGLEGEGETGAGEGETIDDHPFALQVERIEG